LSEKKESVTEKKVSRRSMLKWTGALAAAAAVGAVAGYGATELMKPPPTPPPSFKPPLSPEVQARRDTIVQDLINRHADETISYYRFNTYTRAGTHQCVVKVRIKDGVLTAIEPDDTVNPNVAREDEDWDNITKGTVQARSDARWMAYRKMIYDPQRLTYPMKRAPGEKKGDPHAKFVRISWDEALDIFSTKIKETIEKYGPYSLYNCEQIFILPAWLDAGVRGWSIFSFPGTQFRDLRVWGETGPAPPVSTEVWNMFNTKLIVAWGYTPCEGGDSIPRYYTTLAHEKGIPIIGINPHYTPSDEVQYDQWIPIRAGTDPAMMLAIANVLIKEDLYDKAFVDKFVYGFDKWKDYLMGVTDNVEKTPEWAEALTGVPAETTRELARLLAKSKPFILVTAGGVERYSLGENSEWAGTLLCAMTGNMGMLGAGPTAKPTGFASMPTPNLSAQYGRTYVTASGKKFTVDGESMSNVPVVCAFMRWTDMVLLREKLDNGEITKEQYAQAIGNTAENPSPNVRVDMTTHYSIHTLLNINKQALAVSKLDLFVSHRAMKYDSNFKLDDLCLPLAEEMEKEPMFMGFPQGFCFSDKLLNPPGECHGYEWLMIQLAKRLGVVDKYFGTYSKYGDDKYDQMWQDMAKAAYEQWAASETVKPLNPPSWEEFKKKPVFRWTKQGPVGFALDGQINKGVPFSTKSGKINAYSDYLAQGEEFLKTTKYGGYVDPYPVYRTDLQIGGFHEANAPDRPLHCHTPQPRYHTHSWMADNPWLKDELYQHTVLLSVPDAKARGIKDGDMVRIYSDVGECVAPASVTSRLVPGCCILHKGAYWDPDPITNLDRGANPATLMTDQAVAAKTYANINRVQVVRA
jgi:anaerobic dimethyl sulfoxide reductase subunit A